MLLRETKLNIQEWRILTKSVLYDIRKQEEILQYCVLKLLLPESFSNYELAGLLARSIFDAFPSFKDSGSCSNQRHLRNLQQRCLLRIFTWFPFHSSLQEIEVSTKFATKISTFFWYLKINLYFCILGLRCSRWHQSPRMKRELRCKSETIPVAVSFITLRAFSMVTARRVGRPHGGNKSEDLPLSVFLDAFGR